MDQFFAGLLNPLNLAATVIAGLVLLFGIGYALLRRKLFLLMLKNLRRNLVRTLLICIATVVLVSMVTAIWTVVYILDQVTQEKSKDFKIIITERWQLPSQMPPTHANYLDPDHSAFLPELAGKYTNRDFM